MQQEASSIFFKKKLGKKRELAAKKTGCLKAELFFLNVVAFAMSTMFKNFEIFDSTFFPIFV